MPISHTSPLLHIPANRCRNGSVDDPVGVTCMLGHALPHRRDAEDAELCWIPHLPSALPHLCGEMWITPEWLPFFLTKIW